MIPLVRLLSAILVLFFAAAASCGAQPAAPSRPAADAVRQLDGARATLDQIERTLQRGDLGDPALVELRDRLAPLAEATQAPLRDLGPQLDAVKARLDQLGPAPAEKAPPESVEISVQRTDLQKQFDEIDSAIKRARLLGVQIDQASDSIGSRRRALFTGALFTRSFSIASPELWLSAVSAFPREAVAIATIVSDWLSALSGQLRGPRLIGFLVTILAIAGLYVLALRLQRRVIFRDPAAESPDGTRKAAAAVWTAAVASAAPVAASLALLAAARAFDLLNPRMEPLTGALGDFVTRVALTLGLTRALLAPGLPAWRLIDVPEAAVARISGIAMRIALILSISKIGEAFAEIVFIVLPVVIVWRGLTALAVAATLAAGLRGLGPASASDDECLGPVVAPARDWGAPARVAAWSAVATILASTLGGYVAFASFLSDQIAWVAFIGGALFLLTGFARQSVTAGLRPEAGFGRAVLANAGLRREALGQISILVSGLATLGLTLTAAMLALAPWGIESNDMLGNFRAAFFGFKVGDITVSLSSIIVSGVIFAACWALARALRNWLETRYLPLTSLDVGLRNAIKTSVGYIGFVLAISLALGNMGLSFEKLAIVAGALSVGIGFGLQSIVNNFVSGLILLWERAIRVGDWVVVGDEQGYVRRINVRSTEIETFDRATVIVPNSSLVSGVVKNWVRNDRVGRIRNSVAVNLGADPEKVRETLLGCARAHELVLQSPAPQVMFVSMTENMLRFDLVSFVGDVERGARVRSDLNFAIFRQFGEAGLPLLTTPLPTATTTATPERAEAVVARGSAGP